MRKNLLRHSRVALPVAVATVALGGLASLSGAWFTDSKTIGGNIFTTGTVILNTTPATAAITAPALAPGDTVYAPITVKNDGSLAYRYAVSQSADNADGKGLASALSVDVAVGAPTCDAAGFASGTKVNGVGATFATSTVFGDATQGQQAGDRTIAAGANEVLCFKVALPTSAANTSQGATTTGVLTFSAEQVKNN